MKHILEPTVTCELLELCKESLSIIKSSEYQRALLQSSIKLERLRELEKKLEQVVAKTERERI